MTLGRLALIVPFALSLSTTATAQCTGTDYSILSHSAGSRPNEVALGDLDGDGALDAVTANRGCYNYLLDQWEGFGVSVLLGDGAGGFSAPIHYPFAVGHAELTGVDLGDVDGDGALDLVTVNYLAGSMTLLRGLGDGSFTAAGSLYAGSYPSRVALGDIDGDGDLDVAVSNKTSVRLYNNLGAFAFSAFPTLAPEAYRAAVASVAGHLGHGDTLDLRRAQLFPLTAEETLAS
ncbi:FG-GAP repeat domain-containing protein [Engelhardtia mirabilis]|uniref:FG-GAP repeat protein n=1 Tax=Engelhardtia mirabilis TaxID=2528011 RepID=A0A518BH80_9BACT|nr:FG-GAP repeat protein [Planctomycetes bacterium Pla133]QDV00664.1 FG-GAP repeat protein [Planctomycetes bacterium Pla86]